MFDLSISLANMTEATCTANNILKIFIANSVIWTQADADRGFAISFSVNENKHFYLIDDENCKLTKKIIKEKLGNDTKILNEYVFSDNQFFDQILWENILPIKNTILNWIDYIIINEKLNYEEITKFINNKQIMLSFCGETKDPWMPNLGFSYILPYLQDYIIAREFLWPLYKRKGHEFERLRRCPECGTYFYAANNKKAFCSDKCRNKNFYRQQRKNQLIH